MKFIYKKQLAIFLLVATILILFSFTSKFFEIAKQLEIYTTLFKELNMYYVHKINPAEFTEKAIKNTLKSLDPYTRFYTEQDVEDAKIRREGEYGGVGISVYYDKKGITISEIYEGFPADKAGLKAGDIITKVNDLALKGLEKNQLSSQLKGVPNTHISIEIDRQGKVIPFQLQLGKININPVPFYQMIDAKTGYIVLTRFNLKASKEVKKAFKGLKKKGMQKLIFDLRGNPGGSLRESINIVNFFTPKGSIVVKTRGKVQKMSNTYKGNNNPLDLEIPIVVLVNGRSASASEIVSGALQDYDRAVIMGTRSFGKGLVQRYFKLTYGTQLKATISKYYTPSGRCIQELDYANRDPKTGEVPKFSEGTVHAFTTQNGRTVYDGGGVLPDVKINESKQTKTTKKLLQSRAIFNFSTDYIVKNPTTSLENFTFSYTNFINFTNYLKTADTTFVTKQENLFNIAYKAATNNNSISKYHQQIQQALKTQKISEINKNKDILKTLLQDEILERSFYKKGVYQYRLKNDPTILQAIKLLQNEKKYNRILAKK